MNLKPCPFCGSAEPIIQLENDDEFIKSECKQVVCDARVGGRGASSGYKMNPIEAVNLWNN